MMDVATEIAFFYLGATSSSLTFFVFVTIHNLDMGNGEIKEIE